MFTLPISTLRAYGQSSTDTAGSKKNPENEKVYELGGDVKRPKLLHHVEPEFSAKSKEAFVDGTVMISTVAAAEGLPTAFQVLSGLNAE